MKRILHRDKPKVDILENMTRSIFKKIKGDFDMRTYASLLKGGESEEPSIVPGKPLQSPLYMAVKREHKDQWEPMPPKENDKLSTEQTDHIRNWIEGGASWPGGTDEVRAGGEIRKYLAYSKTTLSRFQFWELEDGGASHPEGPEEARAGG